METRVGPCDGSFLIIGVFSQWWPLAPYRVVFGFAPLLADISAGADGYTVVVSMIILYLRAAFKQSVVFDIPSFPQKSVENSVSDCNDDFSR